jgi:hypothetical protein
VVEESKRHALQQLRTDLHGIAQDAGAATANLQIGTAPIPHLVARVVGAACRFAVALLDEELKQA